MLSRRRLGLALSFAIACIAALTAVLNVSPRYAGARTQILVDDSKISVLNSGFDVTSFSNLHEGAVLAGTLIVQDPTRDYIAHRAGIPVSEIGFTDPQTPVDPPLPEREPALKYSLTVAARPTVPIVDVYAQAPTAAAARRLADASAAGLSDYLASPGSFGLRITQLGNGADVAASSGGTLQSAIERFLLVFALGCFVTLKFHRLRLAWPLARRLAQRVPSPNRQETAA